MKKGKTASGISVTALLASGLHLSFPFVVNQFVTMGTKQTRKSCYDGVELCTPNRLLLWAIMVDLKQLRRKWRTF